MKLSVHSILPFLIVLGGGMAVGSLHNAVSRGVMESGFGNMAMFLTLLVLIAGLIIGRYYEGLPAGGFGAALALAAFVSAMGLMNLVPTLSSGGRALIHEYLIPIAGVLQLVKLIAERAMTKKNNNV